MKTTTDKYDPSRFSTKELFEAMDHEKHPDRVSLIRAELKKRGVENADPLPVEKVQKFIEKHGTIIAAPVWIIIALILREKIK